MTAYEVNKNKLNVIMMNDLDHKSENSKYIYINHRSKKATNDICVIMQSTLFDV